MYAQMHSMLTQCVHTRIMSLTFVLIWAIFSLIWLHKEHRTQHGHHGYICIRTWNGSHRDRGFATTRLSHLMQPRGTESRTILGDSTIHRDHLRNTNFVHAYDVHTRTVNYRLHIDMPYVPCVYSIVQQMSPTTWHSPTRTAITQYTVRSCPPWVLKAVASQITYKSSWC